MEASITARPESVKATAHIVIHGDPKQGTCAAELVMDDRREALRLMAWREAWDAYEKWADEFDIRGEYDLP